MSDTQKAESRTKMVIEIDVNYTYDEPVSSGLLRAVRNSELTEGKIVVEKEGDYFNLLLYDGPTLLGCSSLDFYYHENFIDGGDKGPIYLDVDLSDLSEELYSGSSDKDEEGEEEVSDE